MAPPIDQALLVARHAERIVVWIDAYPNHAPPASRRRHLVLPDIGAVGDPLEGGSVCPHGGLFFAQGRQGAFGGAQEPACKAFTEPRQKTNDDKKGAIVEQ